MGLLDIEKVLDVRDIPPVTATTSAVSQNLSGSLSTHIREFHVKWKGKSYMHCSWVSEEALQHAFKAFKGPLAQAVQQKLRKFLGSQQSLASTYFYDEDEGQITGTATMVFVTAIMYIMLVCVYCYQVHAS
jgi:hypothetical protein